MTRIVIRPCQDGLQEFRSLVAPEGMASTSVNSPMTRCCDEPILLKCRVDKVRDSVDHQNPGAMRTYCHILSCLLLGLLLAGVVHAQSEPEAESEDALTIALAGGIARPTRVEAADAFLALLGVDHDSVEIAGDGTGIVFSDFEGGRGPEIARLRFAPAPGDDTDRWIVVEATSEQIVINEPFTGAVVRDETFVVTGQGTGLETVITAELRSATDGRVAVRWWLRRGASKQLLQHLARDRTGRRLVGKIGHAAKQYDAQIRTQRRVSTGGELVAPTR